MSSQAPQLSIATIEVGAVEVECPGCACSFTLEEDAFVSEIVGCPDCGLELEVFLNEEGKPGVREAPQEEEDWGE